MLQFIEIETPTDILIGLKGIKVISSHVYKSYPKLFTVGCIAFKFSLEIHTLFII